MASELAVSEHCAYALTALIPWLICLSVLLKEFYRFKVQKPLGIDEIWQLPFFDSNLPLTQGVYISVFIKQNIVFVFIVLTAAGNM